VPSRVPRVCQFASYLARRVASLAVMLYIVSRISCKTTGSGAARTRDPIIRSDALWLRWAQLRYAVLQGIRSRASRREDSNPGPRHYEVFSLAATERMVEPNRDAETTSVCHSCANLLGAGGASRRLEELDGVWVGTIA
jgi:hypothetical protein